MRGRGTHSLSSAAEPLEGAPMMPSTVDTRVQRGRQGLLDQRESDEPLTAFSWGKAEGPRNAELVRKLAKIAAAELVEEVALADLFKDLTAEQDWHEAKEK